VDKTREELIIIIKNLRCKHNSNLLGTSQPSGYNTIDPTVLYQPTKPYTGFLSQTPQETQTKLYYNIFKTYNLLTGTLNIPSTLNSPITNLVPIGMFGGVKFPTPPYDPMWSYTVRNIAADVPSLGQWQYYFIRDTMGGDKLVLKVNDCREPPTESPTGDLPDPDESQESQDLHFSWIGSLATGGPASTLPTYLPMLEGVFEVTTLIFWDDDSSQPTSNIVGIYKVPFISMMNNQMLDAINSQPNWAPKAAQMKAFDEMIGRVGNTSYEQCCQLVFTNINYDKDSKQSMIDTVDWMTRKTTTTYFQEGNRAAVFGNGSTIVYSAYNGP